MEGDLDDILITPKACSKKELASESLSQVEPFVLEKSDFRELNVADNPVGANASAYITQIYLAKSRR